MLSANSSQVSNDVKYIEDVCSVYLRTGTGSSQTVTTGVKENTGALVISKSRSAATDWAWYDTFRGATYDLVSNSTAAQTTQAQGLTSFNADGHTWGTLAKVNTSGATYVDTVLKPTPKFFDVVTYTGDGTDGRAIAHSLGSIPGCYIVKRTEDTSSWAVYHRGLNGGTNPQNYFVTLNTTNAQTLNTGYFGTAPTSTSFYVSGNVNANGSTYVVYLFAHDAGGFGLTGTDNVISCGSFTTDGSGNATVSLGYEPQWILYKNATTASDNDWTVVDTMRGWTASNTGAPLYPNLSNAEGSASSNKGRPTSTGFAGTTAFAVSATYIYIAIRRGPMKVPTDGTTVFATQATAGAVTANDKTTLRFTSNFPVDLSLMGYRTGGGNNALTTDRLRGFSTTTSATAPQLVTSSTGAESVGAPAQFDNMLGQTSSATLGASSAFNAWMFKRAPSFFDEVCYTGTGIDGQNIKHNLGVAPELMIVKRRSSASTSGWRVYSSTLGNANELILNTTAASGSSSVWFSTTPTSTQFTVGLQGDVGANGSTYVAYLFATCAGVSKVGSFTISSFSQVDVNCGFTAGARFVMVKLVSGTDDWKVFDTARGIVSGGDPMLRLNSTAAESSGDDLDPYSQGFTMVANQWNNGDYIFLAIA